MGYNEIKYFIKIMRRVESITNEIHAPGQPLRKQLALKLLCKGVRMAQNRGVFQLEEASLFLRAINEFTIKDKIPIKGEIPKIIHQIWIGKKKPPKWCIDSWKNDYINLFSDWEYKLWTDDELQLLDMRNKKIYNDEPTMRGKSDIARYEILQQYGGIYIDADSLWLSNKNLDPLLVSTSFFACREPKNTQFIANGVIGCTKNNKITAEIIEYISNNYYRLKRKHPHPYSIWLVTNQPFFTEICTRNEITIYPSVYFYPEGYFKENTTLTKNEIEKKYPDSYMFQYWLSHVNYYAD